MCYQDVTTQIAIIQKSALKRNMKKEVEKYHLRLYKCRLGSLVLGPIVPLFVVEFCTGFMVHMLLCFFYIVP